MRYGRPSWQFVIPAAGNIGSAGFATDVTLQINQPNQNFTFALINASNDAALTGATVVGWTSKDGATQASIAGTVTELGHGVYNYAPTQAETAGNCCSFLMTATSAVPENFMFLTAGGLRFNQPGQHVTFCMFTTSGAADTAANVSVFVSKDGGTQSAGAGTTTNLGNGMYDYLLAMAESNGKNVNFLFTASGDVPQNLSVFTRP